MTDPNADESAFGDPLSTTSYVLCVYDYSTDVPSLALSHGVSPGGVCGLDRPCWNQKQVNGYRFRDVDREQDSTAQIVLKSDEAGRRGKILFQVRGTDLVFPPPAGSGFLEQDTQVQVQLVNSDGECWEASYASPAIKNRAFSPTNQFKDKCAAGGQGPCQ